MECCFVMGVETWCGRKIRVQKRFKLLHTTLLNFSVILALLGLRFAKTHMDKKLETIPFEKQDCLLISIPKKLADIVP